jgi:hypothetical protein
MQVRVSRPRSGWLGMTTACGGDFSCRGEEPSGQFQGMDPAYPAYRYERGW